MQVVLMMGDNEMRGIHVLTAALGLSLLAAPVRGQDSELRGTVVSADTGEVVAGAWIALPDQDWGTYSWNDGHFFLPEVPSRATSYDVKALGFEPATLTLEPGQPDQLVALQPDPQVLEGLKGFMDQVERRRQRGGELRVFDREALAFNGAFSLGDYLAQRGVRRVGQVCLDERPGTLGLLERRATEFYMAELVGGYLRLYTEDFVERAARERLELQREPQICSGPVEG
ncbi:MAG: carboxypeptidase regulatory-like domain-containing protein [Gemmatimonadota bacterium]